MSVIKKNVLGRALEMVTIFDAWVGLCIPNAPTRDGVVLSPLRDEKNASFSIFNDGKFFKDHGNWEKGGVWKFVALARQDWTKKEIAEFIIKISGLDDYSKPLRSTLSFNNKRSKYQKNIYLKRRESFGFKPSRKLVPVWSKSVRSYFEEGIDYIDRNDMLQLEVARDRGWPLSWVYELIDARLLSYPILPWHNVNRSLCFLVQAPVKLSDDTIQWRPVGYHQRIVISNNRGINKNSWIYIPHKPNAYKKRKFTEYEKGFVNDGISLPSLPFILGDLNSTKLVVILEGQWDAITFFGSFGFFDNCFPGKIAVFGTRGVNGDEAFLTYYGEWLAACRPNVLIIIDADDAGRRWVNPIRVPQKPKQVSFADRLKYIGARRVVPCRLCENFSGSMGKDFNDFFHIRKPDPIWMWEWLRELELINDEGTFV